MGKLSSGFLIFIIILLYSQNLLSQSIREVRAIQLTYQRYMGAQLSWKLFASEFLKKGEEFFEAKNLYLENVSKGIRISAHLGQYSARDKKFLLKGKIQLRTEKEGEVFTEELYFYPERDLIEAPGVVIIKKGAMEIIGEGLTYQVSAGDFKLHKRARAQFKF
ncbi:MAG: LPS export ABC transporter periplasmic protein LptC [Caldimicrobium sp.]|nr:LPS export ABC transporter periplasmic protein LptC [Caldimicrobium sp.]MCX7874251.1 LPS export ABC transporter periplasmic protein LptC [Caldimicrobium sp.]MDW8093942.1 LPS export ABC transporter periplasmic protein LptC [Caldimicrobium sp.]